MMDFEIKVPIYRTFVCVLIDVSDEFAQRYISKRGAKLDELHFVSMDSADAICSCYSSGVVIVRFKEDPMPEEVAHEFLHAVFFILSTRGISLDSSSEEAYTYLLSFLISEYHRNIKQKSK